MMDRRPPLMSFLRKRKSILLFQAQWIPAFAGMTKFEDAGLS